MNLQGVIRPSAPLSQQPHPWRECVDVIRQWPISRDFGSRRTTEYVMPSYVIDDRWTDIFQITSCQMRPAATQRR